MNYRGDSIFSLRDGNKAPVDLDRHSLRQQLEFHLEVRSLFMNQEGPQWRKDDGTGRLNTISILGVTYTMKGWRG